MPAGAIISFPKGADYVLPAGWQVAKAGQRWLGNGATVQRAAQVTATTTTPVLSGTTVIGLSSVADMYPGKLVAVFGNNGSAAACRTNYPTRVVSVGSTSIVVEPILNSVVRASDGVSGQTIVAGATLHDAGWLMGNNYDMVRAYQAWGGTEADFWTTQVPDDILFEDFGVDGNKANFTAGLRWEVVNEVSMVCHNFKAYGLALANVAGEGMLLSGDDIKVDQMRATQINGNPIHLSAFSATKGCTDAQVTVPQFDNFCLVDIGHSDGGISASNFIYNTKVRGGWMRTSVKAGLGAWDEGNDGLDCEDVEFRDLAGGAVKAKLPASANQQLLEISFCKNKIYNCGLSQIGGDYSQASNNSTAKGCRVNSNEWYDSTLLVAAFIGGSISNNEAHMTTAHTMFTAVANAIPNGKVFDFPSHNGTDIGHNRVFMPNFVGSAVNANTASRGIHVYGQTVDVLEAVQYHNNFTLGGMVGQQVEGGQGAVNSHDNIGKDAAIVCYLPTIGTGQKTLNSHDNTGILTTGNPTLNGVGISGGHRAIGYQNTSTTAWILSNNDRVEVKAGSGYVIGHQVGARVKGDGNHAQMYAGNTRPWEFSSGITGGTAASFWENCARNVSDSGAGAPAGVTLTNNRLLP